MKQAIKTLMMGGVMMALPFMFTSCEDILGHWEKPTPSVEEMLTNLGAALEEGALVTITYTVDGVTYTSTFKKVGDDYVEQSTTSAARALTRGGASVKAELHYITVTNTLNVIVFESAKVVLNAEISCADASCTTTYSSNGSSLQNAKVNSRQVQITYETALALVFRTTGGKELGTVYYNEGDTWQYVYKKQSENGHMVIQIIDADADDILEVFLSNGGSWQLFKDAGCTVPVRPDDIITQEVYVKVETITYQEASWNNSTKKVEYTPVSTEFFTLVSPSGGSVIWDDGTYVVKDNVTIGGVINLNGDVNLILCNGAKLTVNGMISGHNRSLTIYGQSQGDTAGKLEVNAGLDYFGNLTIHGGNITVECRSDGIKKAPLTVYGGILSITTGGPAIYTGIDKNVKVYGGEVNAISSDKPGISLAEGNGTLTVYGGKVTAEGCPAIQGKFTAGEGMTGEGKTIKYKVGSDGAEGIMWGDELEMPTTPMEARNDRYFEAWRPAPPASTSRR